MNTDTTALLSRWNDEFFAGALTEEKLGFFAGIGDFDPAVITFVENALRRVHRIGLRAEDFSELLAWELGFIVPRILPTSWSGMVPPITIARRHELIDDYLAANPWRELGDGSRILDVGCGFPPVTTVDLARRLPGCEITGADPQFGRWIVYDLRGDYASFRDDGELRYFQAPQSDYDHFDELLAGGQATRDNYRAILDDLLPLLDGREGFAEVERDGRRLVQDPIEEHVGDNLSFVLGGFGDDHVPGGFDVIRSMNVLIYFDAAFRRGVEEWVAERLVDGGLFVCGMNWVRSEYSRYSVMRKENGRLVAKEFAFGLEALRPLEMVPFFTFYEDETESAQALELIGMLRADRDLMAMVDERFDAIQADLALCPRDETGHLRGIDPGASFGELEPRLVEFMLRANAEEIHGACAAVLQGAGYEVWRNQVGHTAITPQES